MTKEAALLCGKSVPVGTDPFGRTYWVFSADPTSLFICQDVPDPGNATTTHKQWRRFHKPEEIASVIVCLGKDPLCETLKESFPEATKVIKDRSWSTKLFQRIFPQDKEATKASPLPKEGATSEEGDFGPVSTWFSFLNQNQDVAFLNNPLSR